MDLHREKIPFEVKIEGLLQDQTKPSAHEKSIDIAVTVEDFEGQFRSLRKEIHRQLVASDIDTLTIIKSLTSLPTRLKKEYEKVIIESLPSLENRKTLPELFFQLNPLFSFVDYGLLEYMIKKFGSVALNKDMKLYCDDMRVFMKQTTIKDLIDCLPGQKETPPNFDMLKAKIGEDARKCTLERINVLRKRFCGEVRLSGVTFCHIALEDSNSFIVSWLVPSVLVPDLIESIEKIKQSVFDIENINSVSLGNQWLYSMKLTPFGSQLKKQYQQSQGSLSPVEWIPTPTKKIRLAMIEDRFVRMTISGMGDILHAKSPVELDRIFRNTLYGGEIILIEGAPESGKSTLTLHICQRWGKGELFQQFTVVILVQLRDPAVQRAQTIADLLPVENVAVAQELATELIAINGRGVLLVLDGWDELPPHLQQDSIFRELLPSKQRSVFPYHTVPQHQFYDRQFEEWDELSSPYLLQHSVFNISSDYLIPQTPIVYKDRLLSECSVVVTSRPISSGDLHPVVSSRIEVLRFTPEEQRQYFTECLKGDTEALETLLKKIQENPVVQSICYLPLNAAFIAHTFKNMGQSLPNTEYEIYLSVILSCIQHHFQREGRGHDLPRELASLDDLSRSEAVREPFQHLCELAYHGVIENKVTFSSSDLPQGFNTLGLLQAIESFLQSRKSVFYKFLHLSIQEVISAFYIATWLSDSEQVFQFQQLFDQPHFAAVFQFYAAITKMKNPGIRQVVARMVQAKSKPLLVSLLHCLHEAQDPSLCLYVAEMLKYKLDLSYISLSPLDCFSISFFLSSVASREIRLDLKRCSIDDFCVKCLTKYLSGDVEYIDKVSINFDNNEIHEEGALQIARILRFMNHLHLSETPIGDTGASLISEAMRKTATLKTLSLRRCGITSRGAVDLSRILAQNSSLEKLDIDANKLGDEAICHIAEALKQNKQLKEVWIAWCGITDNGAASLAGALSVNNSLKVLHMGCCRGLLTKYGLSTIIQSLTNNSEFVKLGIPRGFDSTVDNLSQEVNEARKRNGLSPIIIEGTLVDSTSGPPQY